MNKWDWQKSAPFLCIKDCWYLWRESYYC